MLPRTRALCVAALLLGGCRKTPMPPADARPAIALAAFLGEPTAPQTYIEHTGTGPLLDAPGHDTAQLTEQCIPTALPDDAPTLALTQVMACRTTHPDGTVHASLHGTHAVGAVFFAHRTGDAPWQYHAPKVRVPQSFSIGDAWAAQHGSAPNAQLRRCDAEPTPWCADGAAITCVTLQVHHVSWVRNHWCPAHGHMGHEGVVVRVGAAPYWSWSSDATRSDQPLPSLPIAARPLPDLDRMADLAHALTPDRLAQLPPEAARIPE
ncbi:MAG TPA: hypothetical protein DFR83_04640 [Deltaproteobacteria bacterium]|nr:hypothetical protein [Deltaproteobacteria bacterium]